ncbi:MAG: hypothetical protein IJW61_03930 [Clostridia bacterium]|nr:hypothetical protein [Clostridia bacterium]
MNFGTVACAPLDTSRYGLKRKSRTSVLPSIVGEPKYCNAEYGNFITDEYTHTLRLESELSDLRVGYANPYPENLGFSGWDDYDRSSKERKHHPRLGGVFFGEP